MNDGNEVTEEQIIALLQPSTRTRVGSSIASVGNKIRIFRRGAPWWGPRTIGPAIIDWGALLVGIGGGIGLGVAGNAAYDLAKQAVVSFFGRTRASERVATRLTRDEAFAMAVWAIIWRFHEDADSLAEKESKIDGADAWSFVLANKHHTYSVMIPAGQPDVTRVKIQRKLV